MALQHALAGIQHKIKIKQQKLTKLEALGKCIPPPRHACRGCLSSAGDVVTS